MNGRVDELTVDTRRRRDVVVVGTGMAGATFGWAMARAGASVVFCEMGRSHLEAAASRLGVHPESLFEKGEVPQPRHAEILAATGRYSADVVDLGHRRRRRHVPYIGSGTGGSSALYGAALERFFPQDFEPRSQHPDARHSGLPERWPISYAELEPYYLRAERLYRVRGTPDPLRGSGEASAPLDPPPMSGAGEELYSFFTGKGLHPYRLPQACEFVEGCEGCQGILCPRECKNDSSRICLRPALENHGAELLDECEVMRLEARGDRVTGVICARRGREVRLEADLVVLGAGALETPRLLLRSGGLANGSGLVGRYLMRHFIDLWAVQTHEKEDLPSNQKELAFNDLYAAGSTKLGTVQSFGALPPREVVLAEMRRDLGEGAGRWIRPLFPLATPFLVTVLDDLRRRVVLASVMEDLPFEGNQMAPSDLEGARVEMRYRICGSERVRIDALRRRMHSILRPYRFRLIKQAESNDRIAHVCGTCRFGDDPRTSVLDRFNRTHDLVNLLVLDSSFFPSSGGTNPALTIAANALRVAEHVAGRRTIENQTEREGGRGER